MLFNSYAFILGFLPIAVLVFHGLARRGAARAGVAWIVLVSFVFYAWWDVRFIALLVASIAVNYGAGRLIERSVVQGAQRRAGWLLAGAITIDLVALGGFKYLDFLIGTVNPLVVAAFGSRLDAMSIVLPLGISFFTFEQISYLVDTRRSGRAERDLLRYALFVVFFPRLVAGPILKASEILPQIAEAPRPAWLLDATAVGLTLFALGLFKKTFLADGVAPYASAVFAAAAAGESLDMIRAWGGALAYTFQLYFDFSGYSDMAVGAALCFGIRFPMNFFSPYKATSIIEFWRRWHMTLSRFLRVYLYFPLGGNRLGPRRRAVNLFVTMLLGGLWHGASWTFVLWGGLHGVYLLVNHGWREWLEPRPGLTRALARPPGVALAWTLTFLCVVVAWVVFRAPSLESALAMLGAMAGANGVTIPDGLAPAFGPLQAPLAALGVRFGEGSGALLVSTWVWVAGLLALVLVAPNSNELLARVPAALDGPRVADGAAAGGGWRVFAAGRFGGRREGGPAVLWQPTLVWAWVVALIGLIGVLSISRGGEFLYWRF